MAVKQKMIVLASLRVKLPVLNIFVGQESHESFGEVRHFGVTLDVHHTMAAHIKSVQNVIFPAEDHTNSAKYSASRRPEYWDMHL